MDGTLTLDSDTLDAALNNNFADVTGFLQNSGGFGQNLSATLNNMGSQSTSGAIYLAQQQNRHRRRLSTKASVMKMQD